MSLLQKLEDLDDVIAEMLTQHDGVQGLLNELRSIFTVANTVVSAIDADSGLSNLIESALSIVDAMSNIADNNENILKDE